MYQSTRNRALLAALLAAAATLSPIAHDPMSLTARLGPRQAVAGEKLSVITTTQDLASIATEVGGDRVRVESLSKGYQDPHFVDGKPSYLVKLRSADLFVEVGRDLEIGWVPGLLNSGRNPRILPGASGFVDASVGVEVLELGARVGREQGDVHPLGNPHYWLNPENGLVIAANIRDGLTRIAPADQAYFQERYSNFEKRLRESLVEWKRASQSIGLAGSRVVTYHRSWPYLARAFGFEVMDYVEPMPGVPPSPRHIQKLTTSIKEQKVRLLIVEPYFDPKLATQMARNSGAVLVILPPSVGAIPEVPNYFKLFDVQLALIKIALGAGAGS